MKHVLLAATAALVARPALADMTVEIPFTAQIEGTPFVCTDRYTGLGSAATEVRFLDFRLAHPEDWRRGRADRRDAWRGMSKHLTSTCALL